MIDAKSLAALSAVLRHGSFESAAHELSVTSSAISQRIKALEDRMGAVLVQRGPPATATEFGQRLHRHAEEVGLLEASLAKDLNFSGGHFSTSHIKIAINADSLATWLLPALAACEGLFFELVVDDQDHSAEWLRRGEVQAAVTSRATPIQGSDCTPLGYLRYIASASPTFVARWFPDGLSAQNLQAAPSLLFDRKDRLQKDWVRSKVGRPLALQSHQLPSTHSFIDAALLDLGWGMNPEALIKQHLATGRLVALDAAAPMDVPLYWQANRRIGTALAPLTRAIKAAAKGVLEPA